MARLERFAFVEFATSILASGRPKIRFEYIISTDGDFRMIFGRDGHDWNDGLGFLAGRRAPFVLRTFPP